MEMALFRAGRSDRGGAPGVILLECVNTRRALSIRAGGKCFFPRPAEFNSQRPISRANNNAGT